MWILTIRTLQVAQDLFDGKPTEEVVSLIPELQGGHMSHDNIEKRCAV